MEVESLYASDQIVSKEIPDNPDMTKYIRELKEDLILNQRNLKEKSLMVSALKSKWLNYYFLEKSNLKRIKNKRDEIIKSKLSSNVQKSILPLKNTEKIANEDENVKKLDLLNDRVKANIDFLERAMNIINDFSYSIRNSIDIIKLERM